MEGYVEIVIYVENVQYGINVVEDSRIARNRAREKPHERQ